MQFGNAVGTSEISGWRKVPAVFPNPARTNIAIRGIACNALVEVFDALGQRLISTNENLIDVSDWREGVYFVKADGRTQRIIVQH